MMNPRLYKSVDASVEDEDATKSMDITLEDSIKEVECLVPESSIEVVFDFDSGDILDFVKY